MMDGAVQMEMHRTARAIFYPYHWDREQAQRAPVIRHMVECEGVTEADVRDMRFVSSYDAAVVRAWNWRKFYVSGLHMHEHEVSHQQQQQGSK